MCDDNEKHKKQMGDHLVANEETIAKPAENDGHIKELNKGGRYPKNEQGPPREWWKNLILSTRVNGGPMGHF